MTLDEALADARNTFSAFPEDAFVLWLDDRIRSNGWPPIGIEWEGFLYGKPISFWQGLKWHQEVLSIRPEDLTQTAFDLIMQIIQAGTGQRNLMSWYIPKTADRFKSCLAYVRTNTTVPGTILLLRDLDGLYVIDGNHRIAALLAVQSELPSGYAPLSFSAWVAA
jgi:hypothetical protein